LLALLEYHALLLNVLQKANGADYGKLRVEAVECVGFIGACRWSLYKVILGPYRYVQLSPSVEVFRWDGSTLVELLMRMQHPSVSLSHFLCAVISLMLLWSYAGSPTDSGHTPFHHKLVATWAKICQTMGPEFEPSLPVLMPPLVNAASTNANISLYGNPSFKSIITSETSPPKHH
jgi:importin-5